MGKELKELMQITIVGENTELSKMIEDIVPIKENRFTDLELEASKKEDFSLVIYKKENILARFIKGIKISIEKIKIMNKSKDLEYKAIRDGINK